MKYWCEEETIAKLESAISEKMEADKAIIEKLEYAKTELERIKNCTDKICGEHQNDEEVDLKTMDHIIKIVRRLDIDTRKSWDKYFMNLRNAVPDFEKIQSENYDIKAEIYNQKLFIKMPILIPKESGFGSKGSGKYPWNYGRFFAKSVREQVAKTLMADREYLLKIASKTIAFLYVYPTKNKYVTDTDSHDKKAIIDAICELYIGGDAAVVTSIFESTVKLNSLESGTYICVFDDKEIDNLTKAKLLESVIEWTQKK